MHTPGIKDVVNRPNHAGTTPLHEACRTGDSWKVFLLWNAGAEPLNDKNGEKPKLESYLKEYTLFDNSGAPIRPLPSQGVGIQYVLDYKSIETAPLFKAWDPSNEHGEPEQKILQLFEQPETPLDACRGLGRVGKERFDREVLARAYLL